MKTGAFIPIKARNERVPNKNVRPYRGRPLFEWILDAVRDAGVFDLVVVDTDIEQVAEYVGEHHVWEHAWQVIEREPALATDQANGNDLLNYHAARFPGCDLYFQLFATSPGLSAGTIRSCVQFLQSTGGRYDSVLTARPVRGWPWKVHRDVKGATVDALPLYRVDDLPRSQDHAALPGGPLLTETCGLYGIKAAALRRLRTRVGVKPYFWIVPGSEAADIDEESDLR